MRKWLHIKRTVPTQIDKTMGNEGKEKAWVETRKWKGVQASVGAESRARWSRVELQEEKRFKFDRRMKTRKPGSGLTRGGNYQHCK